MASNAEMVAEFREIVDGMVVQAEDAPMHWDRRGKGEMFESHGMIFTSVDGSEGRYSNFPFYKERIWGASLAKKQQTDRFTGSIALISVCGQDEQLTRFWSFDTGMQLIHEDTEKVLNEADQIEAALNWVKSPHIYPDTLKELGILDPEEIEKVTPRLDSIAQRAASMHEDLARIAARSRRPMPNIGPVAR